MKFFTSLLGISMMTEDARGLEIYQGIMCFAYISSKFVGSYKQIQHMCESKDSRFRLRGKPADSQRACNLNMQDIESNQQKWFGGKSNMRNLNKEFKKEYFTADELVKLLIEIEFLTMDDACRHGESKFVSFFCGLK